MSTKRINNQINVSTRRHVWRKYVKHVVAFASFFLSDKAGPVQLRLFQLLDLKWNVTGWSFQSEEEWRVKKKKGRVKKSEEEKNMTPPGWSFCSEQKLPWLLLVGIYDDSWHAKTKNGTERTPQKMSESVFVTMWQGHVDRCEYMCNYSRRPPSSSYS